jgi:hypothetical protein
MATTISVAWDSLFNRMVPQLVQDLRKSLLGLIRAFFERFAHCLSEHEVDQKRCGALRTAVLAARLVSLPRAGRVKHLLDLGLKAAQFPHIK